MKISIFGTGYVGLVTGACLADLGHEILCVDIDEQKIINLKQNILPFYEPGLKEIVVKGKEKGRLKFTTNVEEAVQFGKAIFNCVGTPSQEDGSADLNYVFSVAESVAKFAKEHKILINKSTVPPGTTKKSQEIIDKHNAPVEVISNPEFLKEGSAVHDFTHPDKIVVGASSEQAFTIMKQVYSGLIRPYFNIIETSKETAEMIKYANNSFLATKISFINEIANICDKVGADIKDISKAIGMDYRISPKFLNAGTGYGGSCFPKDIKALVYTAKEHGYEAKLLREVHEFNERQKTILSSKIKAKFGEDLTGRSFAVLGLAFKPKTSDVRDAPSLLLIKSLLNSGAKLNVYDPVALEEIKMVFGDKINYCSRIHDTIGSTSAIIIMTEWDEFRNIDLPYLATMMKEKVIFDGRNIYNAEQVKDFDYYGIGR